MHVATIDMHSVSKVTCTGKCIVAQSELPAHLHWVVQTFFFVSSIKWNPLVQSSVSQALRGNPPPIGHWIPPSPQTSILPHLGLALCPGLLTPVLIFVNGVFCISNTNKKFKRYHGLQFALLANWSSYRFLIADIIISWNHLHGVLDLKGLLVLSGVHSSLQFTVQTCQTKWVVP